MTTFNKLLYNDKLLQSIQELGYESPTLIQQKAIPLVLDGKDMIAKSNTGTGKTAAFGLPLLEKLADNTYQKVLVVAPTRELVQQVNQELCRFKKYIELQVVSVYGGASMEKQIHELKRGYHVIVGTPGRILDHVRRKTLDLSNVDAVVLDEADEMLNMGFIDDMEMILSSITKVHQTLLFSATMPKEIVGIAKCYLKDPAHIEVRSKQKTVDKIAQYYYDVRRDEKTKAVKMLLEYYDCKLCIIFCNTKAKVDELCDELGKSHIKVAGLHGDIKQERRTQIMKSFKKAEKGVLIASDVAARGIDINNVDLVINYDIPLENELYIHRVGRTGRAGKEGVAISFVQSRRQYQQLKKIMKYIKTDITKKELPTKEALLVKKRNTFKEEVKQYANGGVIQEHLQLANELIKDGLSVEEIISALVGVGFKDEMPSMIKKKEFKNGVELKLSLGKAKGISAKDVENAVLGRCGIEKEDIGKIDVRRLYTIITVKKNIAKRVIEYMHKSKINNKRCEVTFYKKDKKKG